MYCIKTFDLMLYICYYFTGLTYHKITKGGTKMIELRGKYTTAYVYTDIVDQESISQVIELLNQPMSQGQTIRMMPDIHAGAGCTIGTTMTVGDKIIPNLVGVDIGCGMEVTYLADSQIDFAKLDNVIRNCVPSGMAVRNRAHAYFKQIDLSTLRCAKHVDTDYAKMSLGTLGGGNHFIEVDKDDSGRLLLVIHSGSRHLGTEVARYYQKAAYLDLNKRGAEMLVLQLKAQGRDREIESELKKYSGTRIPKDLAYCEGQLMDDYVHDMKIVQQFAKLNRKAITQTILTECGLTATDSFTTIHNYLDTDNMILRKGAVSAQKGERLIIPMNMRDGALICIGKGNAEWNYSAPHGAGRLINRGAAKASLQLSEFVDSMQGIYSTSVGQSTIDESPMAYKPMQSIIDNIGDTVDIEQIVKSVYNFKASEDNSKR